LFPHDLGKINKFEALFYISRLAKEKVYGIWVGASPITMLNLWIGLANLYMCHTMDPNKKRACKYWISIGTPY
jgi:hypothetical protein